MHEGSRMILGDRGPPAIENVHTELSTTNGMTVLPNSTDSMSSVMFSESSKEIEPERAAAESPWQHRFASTSARLSAPKATPVEPETTPIRPEAGSIELEATPIEGEGTAPGHLISITCRGALSRSPPDGASRTAHVAQRGGLLDYQASKGAVHPLDCAHHCGWYNFIPWCLRIRPRYNPRTSRSDHCWGDRARGRQAAEARTEFRRRFSRSTGAGKRPSNHRGRG